MQGDAPVEQEKQSATAKKTEPGSTQVRTHLDEFFDELKRGVYQPKSATLGALQRIALAMEAEDATQIAEAIGGEVSPCGHRNPPSNRFCSSCGVPLASGEVQTGQEKLQASAADSTAVLEEPPVVPQIVAESTPLPPGQHYYHHHYHHHYFSGAENGATAGAEPRGSARDVPRTRGAGAGLSRSEAAVRQLTQDWAQACNTKQIDDLLVLYASDAVVMRPNVLPMRGAGVLREFFVTTLDSGLGEVEFEPVRTEVLGEVAYEAGRCQMLVPTASGKRREERGKYLILSARQSGEWKIVADSWSSDLTLGTVVDGEQVKAAGQSSSRSVSSAQRKG